MGGASMEQPAPSVDGLDPRPVRGAIEVPVSKSLAQRAMVAASLARGWTLFGSLAPLEGEDLRRAAAGVVRRTAAGSDVAAAVNVARTLARECVLAERRGELRLAIEGGVPFGQRGRREGAREPRRGVLDRSPAMSGVDPERWCRLVDVGESGTLGRLVLAALALVPPHGTASVIRARGSLRQRRSDALVAALRRAGAEIDTTEAVRWPGRVRAASAVEALHLVEPRSSQELSALWLAAAARGGWIPVTVAGDVPSAPYLGLTEQVLGWFGARLGPLPDGGPFDRVVRGPLVAPDAPLEIEADASAAAVALAAGCLSGGEVAVPGLDTGSRQGDLRIVEHLRGFGADASFEGDRLRARGFPTRAAELDLAGEPDLAPVLAAVAGALALSEPASGRSVLTGLGTLPGKESSRIEVLARGLTALGLAVEATDRSLAIGPGRPTAGEVVLDPAGDHRMAFAFALLGLVRPGLRVANPGCVAKSWPGFFERLRRAQSAP